MEKLKAEAKSVRSHNIDAEEVMGMLSVVKKKKNICYISCKMWALKNWIVDNIESVDK